MGLIHTFYKIATTVSFPLAFKLAINRLLYRNPTKHRQASFHTKLNYIRQEYSHIFQKYEKAQSPNVTNNGPIWVCWWQGEENMPELVRMCYQQLLKSTTPEHPVILIHRENYKNYVEIPDYLLEKQNKGNISLTHFCDALRLCLLAEHGGIWIDSTVFVNGTIPQHFFNNRYFSIKTPYDSRFVSRCEFATYFIGAAAGSRWIQYTRDVFLEYWKKADIIIDYTLFDHILIYAYDNFSSLKEEITSGILYEKNIFKIEETRNNPCSEDEFAQYATISKFYKLSNRLQFSKETKEGEETWYGRQIDCILNTK